MISRVTRGVLGLMLALGVGLGTAGAAQASSVFFIRSLRRAGGKLGRTRTAFSRRVKRGRVISQTPAAGSLRPAGTAMTITVSKGTRHR